LPIIQERVNTLSQEQVYEYMIGMMMEGQKDFKVLSNAALGLGFDLTPVQISEIYSRSKRNLRNEMSRSLKEKMLERGKVETSTVNMEEAIARVEVYQQKLIDSIKGSFYDSKNKFLQHLDKTIQIQLVRRLKKEDKSILIFQGDYKAKLIIIKTTLTEDLEVEGASIFFGRLVDGKTKGFNFSLNHLKDKWSGYQGYHECLKDINRIHDFLGFHNIHQTIWFLAEFERYTDSLPTSLRNYLAGYFTQFIAKVEQIESAKAISELVKKKYHAFSNTSDQ